ncbi:hypothetical protein ACFSTA_03980 [Ornithinibacillus salinisoli]|uniref:Uncharacterized protein n=1 Tax=Ornithinibacillus salinisoli TaxID=1848459 RepID=A0ABW4VWH6_9BACI
MENKINFLMISLISIVCITFSSPYTVFAHKMIVEQVEDGRIYVRYDNGTPAPLAYVTIYDKNGKIQLEEGVDENGYLNYEKGLDVHRIIADDGMGHRAASNLNENTTVSTIPIFIRALLGVSILLFIGASYFFRTNTK